MDPFREKRRGRERRHSRLRKRVMGTSERPRLSVYRSLKNIYAQLIDDREGRTLLSLSSLSKEVKRDGLEIGSPSPDEKKKGEPPKGEKGKSRMSRLVGYLIAQKALEKGIQKVVFDRGGFLFHGRIKSLAEGAREGGLKF